MNVPSYRDRTTARRLSTGTAAVMAAMLLAGCGTGAPQASPHSSAPGKSPATPDGTSPSSLTPGATGTATTAATTAADTTPAACTNATKLAGWSNQRLAMLTIAVPVSETSVSGATSEVSAGAGGVVLFGSAAPSDLGSRLTTLKSHVPGHLGLLVMTDEEGGGIQRMANLVGSLPWAAYMGAHWTPAQIQQNVAKVAKKMAAAQVNMNLAPVVDVDGRNVAPSKTNPDGWRSFSGNTAVVSKAGVAYMNGMRDGGVIPVVKHFPGLGGSTYNSDFGPARTLPWSTLQKVGIPPFTAAIKAGAPAIMVSNNIVPGLGTNPASLSPTVISSELRGKLGFKGLVVTDSLSAKAISGAGFTIPAAAVQALRSGADMVMFDLGSNVGSQTSSIASAITNAVTGGKLARSRLIDAAGHVLAVRHVNLCS
ncbi:beta-N-acetylhexosaminidase [Streptomyces sp. Ag109_O5-1]|uniref:glycoside hydrolase family 3 N-terminal domain-containing protein n=1 Tax=Streptomyces sp. Ag109_O5-1 TaxID=1938851 RepID=UPI000FA13865|nr:glycoside hydrolase family 3 N-terminal domain-containing protein [Streptomyces sp. Ag109_O5-1]RPE44349.1 beta-N-acetylhexosaminidase [Streptomyces sp. Ag109_O5-1]